MSVLNLDIAVVPTYNVMTLGITDASTYPDSPPIVTNPTIEITPPGFNKVILTFAVNSLTIYNSDTLGITTDDPHPLPDGVYYFKYSIAPSATNYVEKSIMKVDKLQEKFDEAFLKLDMMECDRAIKTQAKIDLNTIYFFIQGAMSAANSCAIDEASKLYLQAKKMLTYFINNNCGCGENNYLVNF